jgi:hypothetical protein
MSMKKRYRLAKWSKRVGRTIALIESAFFLLFLVGGAIIDGGETIEVAGVLLFLLQLMAFYACILSWYRLGRASVMLILVSIGLGIHICVCAGHGHFLAWTMIGLPYLVAGLLLLYSWRLSRGTS